MCYRPEDSYWCILSELLRGVSTGEPALHRVCMRGRSSIRVGWPQGVPHQSRCIVARHSAEGDTFAGCQYLSARMLTRGYCQDSVTVIRQFMARDPEEIRFTMVR